jgi:hypothetical protein
MDWLLRELLGDDPRIHRTAVECHPDYGGSNTAILECTKMADASEPARSENREFRSFGNVFHQW